VGMFSRVGKSTPGLVRTARSGDTDHLRQWAQARRGVEAFVEPKTTVTETTVLLVAVDGEWTRRRIDGPGGARRLAKSLKIPVYDVQIVGYPQRMRDYDARRRIERGRRGDLM
jgi:hypothetical protein